MPRLLAGSRIHPPIRDRPPNVLRGLLAFLALLSAAFPSPACPQDVPEPAVKKADTPEQKPDPVAVAAFLHENFQADHVRLEFDTETRRAVVFFWGSARGVFAWKGEPVRVFADRIAILAEVRKEERKESERKEPERPPGEEAMPAPGEAPEEAPGAAAERRTRPAIASPTFYAEGNVRLEGEGMVLDADAFFYEHERERGVAVRARGHGKLSALSRLGGILDAGERSTLNPRGLPDALGPSIGPAPLDLEDLPPAAPPEPPPDRPPGSEPEIARALPPEAARTRDAMQMAFRAEVLRAFDARSFQGEGLVISTCEYGVPHFGFGADLASVTRQGPEGDEREGDGRDPVHYEIDPEFSWLEVAGAMVLPLPPARWNTRWNGYVPVRRISPSFSGKFGARLDTRWNLNWVLDWIPWGGLRPVDMFINDPNTRLDAITDYLSKRGFGYGAQGVHGEEPRDWEPWELSPDTWDGHGWGIYYRIDDRGEDRTAPSGTPAVDDARWWGSYLHRQRIPWVGELDFEYSERSDENFLREFFPFTRTEKDQESLVGYRRSFGDTLAITGLYKWRSDEFETDAERLPEGKVFLLEQPVFETGLYTTARAQAANLRLRPGDDAAFRGSRRVGRLDAFNEWSYPFGIDRYVRFRPFASARVTAYDATLDPGKDPAAREPLDHQFIDRESFAAGISASQEWSRVFRMPRGGWMERWFGIRALKHVVIPRVTYFNLFENNLDPDRLVPFDEADAVSELETVEMSVRNLLWGRGPAAVTRLEDGGDGGVGAGEGRAPAAGRVPGAVAPGAPRFWEDPRRIRSGARALLDAEASLRWFTHPARDNGGDRWGPLDLDVVFQPHDYFSARSRTFLDPDRDFEYELFDSSVTVSPIPDALHFTAGERFRRGRTDFVYARVGIEFSRRYLLEAYYGFDLDDHRRNDLEVRVVRFFHRFAFELGYSLDAGERNNQTFSVNFMPVELISEIWNKEFYRDRRTIR